MACFVPDSFKTNNKGVNEIKINVEKLNLGKLIARRTPVKIDPANLSQLLFNA